MLAESPITNCWGAAHTTHIEAEEVAIFRGVPGAAYNHHHQITSLDGRLYATWSTGDEHEDAPGQRMMLATSDDAGATWSRARPLVDRQAGAHGHAVVTSLGIRVAGRRLVAYYGYYDYTETALRLFMGQKNGVNGKMNATERWHQGTHTGIMVSKDAGGSWHGPVARIERFCANLCPQEISTGRFIIPGNMCFPYTDDPEGIRGWTIAGIPRLPADYIDDPEGFWAGKRHRGDEFACCEGSCYETDDGVVHMMLRTETGRLAVTESRDRGETWSEPALTRYTDANCRHHFGRLPDGRRFGLSCPAPASSAGMGRASPRTPMVLTTSEDGVVFDRHYVLGDEPESGPRMEGLWKFGRYGYPSYCIAGETMHVIYSVNKEDIRLKRVPLRAIA